MKHTPVKPTLVIYLILLTLVNYACSKKEVEPADKTDVLSNTTWEAYGFKNPVYGKDVYYYLAFSTNGKGQAYSKYNKTESTDIPPSSFTYTISSTKLTLIYPTNSVELEYTGSKISTISGSIAYAYTKL